MPETKVVIVPGNGCGDVIASNWYHNVAEELRATSGLTVLLQNMPDPDLARESVWIPFMESQLRCDESTIIIGHSSGAEAAMRFCENHQVKGLILVSACVTDLGMESEKVSGYYDRPWLWEDIKANSGFIVQFGSEDDPFIPFDEEQSIVAQKLNSDLRKYTDRGHFMSSTFPELVETVNSLIK